MTTSQQLIDLGLAATAAAELWVFVIFSVLLAGIVMWRDK